LRQDISRFTFVVGRAWFAVHADGADFPVLAVNSKLAGKTFSGKRALIDARIAVWAAMALKFVGQGVESVRTRLRVIFVLAAIARWASEALGCASRR